MRNSYRGSRTLFYVPIVDGTDYHAYKSERHTATARTVESRRQRCPGKSMPMDAFYIGRDYRLGAYDDEAGEQQSHCIDCIATDSRECA